MPTSNPNTVGSNNSGMKQLKRPHSANYRQPSHHDPNEYRPQTPHNRPFQDGNLVVSRDLNDPPPPKNRSRVNPPHPNYPPEYYDPRPDRSYYDPRDYHTQPSAPQPPPKRRPSIDPRRQSFVRDPYRDPYVDPYDDPYAYYDPYDRYAPPIHRPPPPGYGGRSTVYRPQEAPRDYPRYQIPDPYYSRPQYQNRDPYYDDYPLENRSYYVRRPEDPRRYEDDRYRHNQRPRDQPNYAPVRKDHHDPYRDRDDLSQSDRNPPYGRTNYNLGGPKDSMVNNNDYRSNNRQNRGGNYEFINPPRYK